MKIHYFIGENNIAQGSLNSSEPAFFVLDKNLVATCSISLVYGGGSDNKVEPGLTTFDVYDTAMIDRKKVISLSKSGASRNSMARELGYSRATVSKIIKSVDPQT